MARRFRAQGEVCGSQAAKGTVVADMAADAPGVGMDRARRRAPGAVWRGRQIGSGLEDHLIGCRGMTRPAAVIDPEVALSRARS
jgi:hypothetical protein